MARKGSFSVACKKLKLRSFTLIELLVVIAIIAILAAILLPTLQSARNRGKSASCLSQLKQIGSSFFNYADDSKNWGPTGNAWGDGWKWSALLRGYFPSKKQGSTEKFYQLMVCPADHKAPATNFPGYSNSTYIYSSYATFFGLGDRALTSSSTWYGWYLKTLTQGSGKKYNRPLPRLTMFDSEQTHNGQTAKLHSAAKQMIASDRNDNTPILGYTSNPVPHTPGNNLLFGDGHTEYGNGPLNGNDYLAVNYYDEIGW